jgi:predicted NBD/HSP70 family sugar kinase
MAIVVGIDLGGTNVRVAAASADAVLAERRERTDPAGGERLLAQIVRLAREAADGGPLAAAALGTAGVVAPGSLDVAVSNNIPGWLHLRPHEWLERELGVPVLVENDLNLAAVGERWQGLARGVDTFAFVGLGTGLGMGLVVGGELVRGARGAAGELGFLPLAAGPRGAFEREVNGAGVVAAAAAHPRWNGGSPPESSERVFELAAAGEAAACEVVAAVGARLGAAVASVCAVVDPELVVLGGGVGGHELLLEPVRAAARELLPLPPRIERSVLGDRAPLLGAVALALGMMRPG